jgi:hypothetical protein
MIELGELLVGFFSIGFTEKIYLTRSVKNEYYWKSRIMIREKDKKYLEIGVSYHGGEKNCLFLFLKGKVDHHVCPSKRVVSKMNKMMGDEASYVKHYHDEELKGLDLDYKDNVTESLTVYIWSYEAYVNACKKMVEKELKKGLRSVFFKVK